MSDNKILSLNPTLLWKHFYNISQIPHPSKNEGKLVEHIIAFAKEQGLEYEVDEISNILIRKKATAGKENSPGLILQAHIDMVCEKNNDYQHDFDNDPLKLYIEDGFVTAEGTTLGADNGIGAAAILAILEDKEIKHPNLECLFTIDEETGMTGVIELKKDFLTYDTLLNLDTEEEDSIYVGCAGGESTFLSKNVVKSSLRENFRTYKIMLSGLQGGHSGLMIDKQLGNALKLLNRILYQLNQDLEFDLISIQGGDKHNAIPREATTLIGFDPKDFETVKKLVQESEKTFKNELKYVDPDLFITLSEEEQASSCYSQQDKEEIIFALRAIPHGVYRMSDSIENLVETSTNLAAVKETNETTLEILTSQRSSVLSLRDDLAANLEAVGKLANFTTVSLDKYPPWEIDMDTKILKTARQTYQDVFGIEPGVKAIHAGLECAIIKSKYPEMEMISFGPNIYGAHSPDEKVEIASTEKFYNFLLKILENY